VGTIAEGEMIALRHLDRPIAFQRSFVLLTGSVTAALLLSQIVYWAGRAKSDGWFFKTSTEWEEETGLTRYEQESARKILREKGFIQEAKRGVPCKMHFRLNAEVLQAALNELNKQGCGNSANQIAENQQASLLENPELECEKTTSSDAENQQTITEITQRLLQTTSKTKAQAPFVLPDWIPKDLWEDFEAMRRKLRKPLTDKARDLLVGKLLKLQHDGNDTIAVLEQSIAAAWQGVFPVRQTSERRGNGDYESKNARIVREALNELNHRQVGANG
jgi:hypothetical protein